MPDINKLFEKADKYMQKQKLESALETYQEIFKYEPNDEEVLVNLGDLSLRLNRNAEGVRYLTLLVDHYTKKNDSIKAIANCRKILKVTPQDLNTLGKLGTLLEKTNKVNDALEVFREMLALHRAAGASIPILDCLQRIAKLDPNNLNAQVELGEQAVKSRQPAMAAAAFLQAALLARKAGDEARWGELAERAHTIDPENEAASIAAAESYLQQGRAADVVALLDPIQSARPDDLPVMELLAKACIEIKDFNKAQPLCWKLYQANPDAIQLVVKLTEELIEGGKTDEAMGLLKQVKPRLFQQGRRDDYLKIVERMYEADESNLPVLEALCGLYNDMNKEEGLRRSQARLFGLYLAAEQYDRAADTLERIIDVDPYGAGHYDRLLMLEGNIDKIWYDNIASRVQPPSTTHAASGGSDGKGGGKVGLDDLIIEGEMYHQYQLESKLKETLATLNRLYPGEEEKNERLRELYQAAGFMPTGSAPAAQPVPKSAAGTVAAPVAAPQQDALDGLKRISEITANIYREGSPQGVMQVAVNEIGRALNASRCWGALGSPDRAPILTVEYCSASTPSSDASAANDLYAVLMRQATGKPDGWIMHDVTKFPVLNPVSAQIMKLGLRSLQALPLMDRDQPMGILCVEQCDQVRAWSPSDALLLQTTATQVVIAVNNTKLRRMAPGMAGADQATGLLPRSSYISCLLTEAGRAKELSKPLALGLLEPENPTALAKTLGDAGVQQYLLQASKILQSNMRPNDIAVRYAPWAIALILPEMALPQGGLALEKIRRALAQVRLDGRSSPNICCAICDVPLGLRFDPVDGVTEVINRLESAMDQARQEGGKRVLISAFEG
jgi:tetratricopeptide (TPR) repeat protein/GGDEF domain-containing protein